MRLIKGLPTIYQKLAQIRHKLYKHKKKCQYVSYRTTPDSTTVVRFNWDKTREGYRFWHKVQYCKEQNNLPNIPNKTIMELMGIKIARK